MKRLALTLLFLTLATSSYAQYNNQTGVAFKPSDDHNTTITIGGTPTPVVTSYDLRIYSVGQTETFIRYNLGKPAPNLPNGDIQVLNPSFFTPLGTGDWIARVAAIGPVGEGLSEPSLPFTRLAAPRPGGVPRIIFNLP